MKPPKFLFPITNARSTSAYSLVFEDANGITHYFNKDGEYDGLSGPPCTDLDTCVILN